MIGGKSELGSQINSFQLFMTLYADIFPRGWVDLHHAHYTFNQIWSKKLTFVA